MWYLDVLLVDVRLLSELYSIHIVSFIANMCCVCAGPGVTIVTRILTRDLIKGYGVPERVEDIFVDQINVYQDGHLA